MRSSTLTALKWIGADAAEIFAISSILSTVSVLKRFFGHPHDGESWQVRHFPRIPAILQSSGFDSVSLQLTVDWIRLVIVVGGYILLRPFLVRYAAKLQQQNLEKEDTKVSTEGTNKEKEQDNKARKDLQWGASTRIRQRKAAEGQMQGGEDTDDEDLKQLLE
jgi:hypothetical protein